MNKAVFIDKDGTLIPDIPFNVDPKRITLADGALDLLRELQGRGYLVIVVSNQAGVAHGFFEESALATVKARLSALLKEGDVHLDAAYFCPHHPEGMIQRYAVDCHCRKPKPGMILKAAEDHHIDLNQSWMIGDILHDIEAGNRAGCRTILVDNGNETEWIRNEYRFPTATVKNLKEGLKFMLHSVLEQARV